MNLKRLSNQMIKLGTLIAGASVASQCLFKIDPGENAIIFSKLGGGIK